MAIINGTPGDDDLIGTTDADVIHGDAGNDSIRGLEGDDVIDGGDDHDFLSGQQGNDSITGGSGDDLIRPGSGNDTADGGAGWDRMSFAQTGSDTLSSGVIFSLLLQGTAQATGHGIDTATGFEHVTGTPFDDTITGDNGDNWLWGGSNLAGISGNDTIYGMGGNDLIEVGAGTQSLDGGTGTDTLTAFGNSSDITPAGVTISLTLQGASQDTEQGMWLLNGFENLSGSVHDDVLTGDANVNVLAGHIGSDALMGGSGDDTLYGDGVVTVDTHGLGYSGPIVTVPDVTTVVAGLTPGNDTLEGGLGNDLLNGGGGSDTASYANASGSVGVYLIFNAAEGAEGTDTLTSIENAIGSAFDDTIIGDAVANTLSGGAGHDYFEGWDGDDSVYGQGGDDYVSGQAGNDLLDGGVGIDRAAFSIGATAGVTVDLNLQGVAQATGQGNDTLVSIEHASGTRFSDTLTGDGGDNWLWGGSDGSGVTGNDAINAGGGNDLVEVGTGNHLLAGGLGTDTLSLRGNQSDITADGVTVSLALQGGAQATEQGSMTLTGFESLSGSMHADNLTGDGNANLLAGDLGDDVLDGAAGDDTLYGDGRVAPDTHGVGTSGPIATYGDAAAAFGDAAGNDVLTGGRGGDTLFGGQGDDVLSGNQNADRFVIEASSGDDRITDLANMDRIVFASSSGVDAFSDLTLTAIGRDTLVTWGTADSLFLEGVRARSLGAANFEFAAASAEIVGQDQLRTGLVDAAPGLDQIL